MRYGTTLRFFVLLLLMIRPVVALPQSIDLSKSQIFSPTDKTALLRSIEVLQTEVEKRTGLKLAVVKKLPTKGGVILIALESDLGKLPEQYRKALSALPETKSEGFKLVAIPQSNTVIIAGKDPRGIIYGIGRLLRKAEMTPGMFQVTDRGCHQHQSEIPDARAPARLQAKNQRL